MTSDGRLPARAHDHRADEAAAHRWRPTRARRLALLVSIGLLAINGNLLGEGQRKFGLTVDPTEEIIRLTSFPASTSEVTAYTLYGDGQLVWRTMAKRYDSSVAVIEEYGDYKVSQRREIRLAPDQVQELVAPLVAGGLMELTQEQARSETAGWRMRDLGDMQLEVSLAEYAKGDEGLTPRTVVLKFPAPTAIVDHGSLAPIVRLKEQLNEHLGLGQWRKRRGAER